MNVLSGDRIRELFAALDQELAKRAVDVAFLIRHLGLVAPEQVIERIARYYPDERVPPRTRFLVEELLDAARADVRHEVGKTVARWWVDARDCMNGS